MSQQPDIGVVRLILSDQDRKPDPCRSTTPTMVASPLAVIGPNMQWERTTLTGAMRLAASIFACCEEGKFCPSLDGALLDWPAALRPEGAGLSESAGDGVGSRSKRE